METRQSVQTQNPPQQLMSSSFIFSFTDKPNFQLQIFKSEFRDEWMCKFRYSIPKPDMPAKEPEPIDYIMIVDASGSMLEKANSKDATNKIELVKEALVAYMRDHATDKDTISITTFNNDGQEVVVRCPRDAFLDETSYARQAFQARINAITPRDGTYIEKGVDAISDTAFQPKKSKNRKVGFLFTDGKDNHTHVASMAKKFNRKCGGLTTPIEVLAFGQGYERGKLNEIRKATGSKLPDLVHFETAEDVTPRLGFLSNFVKNEDDFTELSVTIEIGGVKKEFNSIIAKYDDVYSREFILNKNLLEGKTAEDLLSVATIQYQHKDKKEKRQQAVRYVEPKKQEFGESDSALIKYVNNRIKEIMEIPVVERINKITRLVPLSILEQDESEQISELLKELCGLRDKLANELEQPSNEANYAMNALEEVLRLLSTHYRYFLETMMGDDEKSATDTISTNNNTINHAVMTTGLSEQLQQKYNPGTRTVAATEQLKGLCGDKITTGADGRLVATIEDVYSKVPVSYEYVMTDSSFDFARYDFRSAAKGLMFVDGGIENREILLLCPKQHAFEYHQFMEASQFLIGTHDGLDAKKIRILPPKEMLKVFISYASKTILPVNSPERQERLEIATYDNKYSLIQENGRALTCTDFNNYRRRKVGLCRHRAMALAMLIARAVQEGRLPPGSVHLLRNTAFNQRAHAFVIYETADKKELYLADDLLGGEAYNLRDPKQLEKAIHKYNGHELNGMLLDLIDREGLDPNHRLRDREDLFDIQKFDPVLLAKVENKPGFEDWICPITTELPTDPVRPYVMLIDEKTKEEKMVLSKQVYERAELEEWLKINDTDPSTRGKIVHPLPGFDHPESQKCRREMYELIAKECHCIYPEEFATGITLQHESLARQKQRDEAREKWYEENKKPIEVSDKERLREVRRKLAEREKEEAIKEGNIRKERLAQSEQPAASIVPPKPVVSTVPVKPAVSQVPQTSPKRLDDNQRVENRQKNFEEQRRQREAAKPKFQEEYEAALALKEAQEKEKAPEKKKIARPVPMYYKKQTGLDRFWSLIGSNSLSPAPIPDEQNTDNQSNKKRNK